MTATAPNACAGTLVNDIHSRLNATLVDRVLWPATIGDVRDAVLAARAEGKHVSIAGGRHAMGGQQFGQGTLLLDMRGMNLVRFFDRRAGTIEVEAGIQWPALVRYLVDAQEGEREQWGIAQKQTGADRLSIGGALSANIHGRGLGMRPIIADVESFRLVNADGKVLRCSREENGDLFRLAIGGYGLLGVIVTVTLRLVRRHKVQRVVDIADVDTIMLRFNERIAEGFRYGDFQFAIDAASDDFLSGGVFSSYRPVPDPTPIPANQPALSSDAWQRLLLLAHTDKRAAVDVYTAHYLSTNGAISWSDLHQMADYTDDYHVAIDRSLGTPHEASEMITEIYVPRPALPRFMARVREDFRANGTDLIYGTVRLVERDDESVLAWAREPWACLIFNLHVDHTATGIGLAALAFRRLIDRAIQVGGSYYLTYHRWATRDQVIACHPRLAMFLAEKIRHDPEERFQSEWYRHYRRMFAVDLASRGARATAVPG